MDDRKFLPQVLRVLAKAYGPAGALQGLKRNRREAVATQYWHASWMAYKRGARFTALHYLAAAVLRCPRVGGRKQLPLWKRYLLSGFGAGPGSASWNSALQGAGNTFNPRNHGGSS
jgi:hypothetical protein